MKLLSHSEKETYGFALKFSDKLKGGEVIALNGDLGSGKTVFTKGLAKGLEIEQIITSPTFTIMNEYEGKFKFYHYDTYRLSGGDEAIEAGLTEYFNNADSVCVIEWAENIVSALPKNLIKIDIKYLSEDLREITINDK